MYGHDAGRQADAPVELAAAGEVDHAVIAASVIRKESDRWPADDHPLLKVSSSKLS
jgi:hypothetical protein